MTGKNVLIVHQSLKETGEKFGLDVETTKAVLAEARKILFEARLKRPKPHLDNKMITAWNGKRRHRRFFFFFCSDSSFPVLGLMISGFAKVSAALNDKYYGERAVKCAEFIKKYLYDDSSKTLLRSCYVDDDRKVVQM